MNDYDQLSSLDGTKTNWCVKIRVSRMWPSISTSGGREVFRGYNLILLDEENCHVHAFVYADNWTTLKKKIEIEEGGLYMITNFYTKDAYGSLRPVSSKTLINFSNSTTVEKIDHDDLMIPMHKFEFVDLGDLLKLAESYAAIKNPEFSTDIIGVLENYEALHDINTVNGVRSVVRFRMTDGRNPCNVTAWAEVAVKAEEEKNKAIEQPIIVIVTSTRLNVYKKTVQASTTPSSKVYMNLDIDSVIAMRQRLSEEGYIATDEQKEKPTQKLATQFVQTMTLKQLSEIETKDYIKKHVYCNIKIVSVEDNGSWWYDSCGGCETEVETPDGKIYCPECKKNIPVAEKRYRIVVLGEDSTEAYNFVMMDRSVKRMVGTTATKLISEKIKNNTKNVFPSQIKALSGKELKLKLLINEDNVAAKSRLFYVVDACDTNVSTSTICSSSDTNYTSSENGGSSAVQFSNNSDTPGTQKSTTKRVKVEP